MSASPHRICSILATLVVLLAPRLHSQTVFSTFGPGDSYKTGTGCCDQWIVQYSQWMAASFTYAGPGGLPLDQIRFAAYFGVSGGGNATASFWAGSNIGGATLIESWALTGYTPDVAQIVSLSSLTGNLFVTGETYWLTLTTPIDGPTGAWRWNDRSLLGVSASFDQGTTWDTYPTLDAPAWDVSAATTVTPEPGSLALLATGLAGMAGAGLARRRPRR